MNRLAVNAERDAASTDSLQVSPHESPHLIPLRLLASESLAVVYFVVTALTARRYRGTGFDPGALAHRLHVRVAGHHRPATGLKC